MKLCIITETAFPYKNCAASKVAYRLGKGLLEKNNSVYIVCKHFGLSKFKISKFEGITYVTLKNNSAYLYSFSEIKYIFRKKVFKRWLSFVLLYFYKLLNKMRLLLNKNSFKVPKLNKFFKYNRFDAIIFVAGNYEIINTLDVNEILAKKRILYAIDYWKYPNGIDYSNIIKNKFDFIIGQKSYGAAYFLMNSYFESGIIIENKKKLTKFSYNNIFSYFGNFYGARDGDAFLKVITKMSRDISDSVFNIYTNNKKMKSKHRNIFFKKEVYGKKYENEIRDSNFLLILDNRKIFSKWIPSKLYEAMAYGKPIIFITNNMDSYALQELKKYDLYFIINYDDPFCYDLDKLRSFIQTAKNKISLVNFYKNFPYCQVENLVDLIMRNLS